MDFSRYNVKTPKQLFDFFCRNLRYGFKYRKKIFTESDIDFQQKMDKLYKIRLGHNFVDSGYGVCWDFCELERDFFLSKHIPHECYFVEVYENREEGGPTHTFALFQENQKWKWFEFSWGMYCGIWEYDTKENALKDVVEKFRLFYNAKQEDIKLFRTNKVKTRLNTFEFVDHCYAGERVIIKN